MDDMIKTSIKQIVYFLRELGVCNMPVSMSVKNFLAGIRTQLSNHAIAVPVRFVTGNQSADMDSVISAISYSYLQYVFDPNVTLIPLINIPRSEFKLRRDIVLLLKTYAIEEDHLFFVEDFSQISAGEKSVELVLVDHCNIQGDVLQVAFSQKKLKVVGIIDHHADEEVFSSARPRIIQPNGSCSSLVFNYWFEQFNNKSVFQNHDIVHLLMGPLLIDTSNMTQKVEENDTIAYTKYKGLLNLGENPNQITCLAEHASASPSKFSPEEFYKTLKKAKKDLSGLSVYDILRKDYKQFQFVTPSSEFVTVGFSSLGKSIHWILKNYTTDDVVSALKSMITSHKLDILVITTSYTKKENDEYTREFAFHYVDDKFSGISALAEDLKLNDDIYHADKVLNRLKPVQDQVKFKVFNQVNILASRKQVVPIVKEILEHKL